jgi:hypothetical protein
VRFTRGTVEYWEVFREDADRFAYTAIRLEHYRRHAPWWARPGASFVIGFLNAMSRAMLRRADAEERT